MQKEFWHQVWQKNEIGFNQLEANELLKHYFKQLHLKPGSRVFVPLCGKSVDMLWLVNQGYKVIGVELSQVACEAFFNACNHSATITKLDKFTLYESEKLTLLCGDYFDLNKETLGVVDAVYDRAALIALPIEMRKLYVNALIPLLEPKTPIFLLTGSYDQTKMQGPPFSVDEEEVRALYGECFQMQQLYSGAVKQIMPHLQARGLSDACDHVYYLLSNPE